MKKENIAILGAGFAGLHTALSIADTGREVTIVDTNIDPSAPLQTRTRQTILFVNTARIDNLGIPTENYPLIKYLRLGERGMIKVPIPPRYREYGVDALSARRTLLQQAQAHPLIDLVEGKATNLQVEVVRGRRRVTGVTLLPNQEITIGEQGLVVVATGRDRNVLDEGIVEEFHSPSRSGYGGIVGGYISSPALSDESRDALRIGRINGMTGYLGPSEQIQEDGTEFATLFEVSKKVLDDARGGNENVLVTLQEITDGTKWSRFYEEAKIDRVLLHSPRENDIRRPSVGGIVLVGDALAHLDLTQGSGIARIVKNAHLLQGYITSEPDLTEAADHYNSLPIKIH